jgi:hypothetical protein
MHATGAMPGICGTVLIFVNPTICTAFNIMNAKELFSLSPGSGRRKSLIFIHS